MPNQPNIPRIGRCLRDAARARTKRAAKHKTENLGAWDDCIKVLSTFYAGVASFKTVEELCHRALHWTNISPVPIFSISKLF